MSWYAMAVKWWADEDVEAAVPWAWPLILDAVKAGDGVASERALSDARLIRAAGLVGVVEDRGRSILDRFVTVGLIVEDDGGYTARSWSEYQRQDEAKKERQRRWREKRRLVDVSETSRDVSQASSERRRDVAETATVQYSTVHDSTVLREDAAVTTSRARTDDPPVPPPPTRKPVGAVVEAFRATQSGREALMVAPRTVQELGAMVDAHGEATVIEAIGRAADSCKPPLTLAYLRPVVEAVARGEPRGKPRVATTSRHFDVGRRTEDFGPQPMPPGEI